MLKADNLISVWGWEAENVVGYTNIYNCRLQIQMGRAGNWQLWYSSIP
jgi:hypothetical protein